MFKNRVLCRQNPFTNQSNGRKSRLIALHVDAFRAIDKLLLPPVPSASQFAYGEGVGCRLGQLSWRNLPHNGCEDR